MNPFMLEPSERLNEWTTFRDALSSFSEYEQLEKVCRWWGLAPLNKRSIDPYDPKSWMTVWEMIYSGDLCQNSLAVAMEATLRLAGWDANRLMLQMIYSDEENSEFLVVKIDNQFLLNYNYGSPASLEVVSNDITVQNEFGFSGRTYKAK